MADLSAMYMDLADNAGRATDRGFLGMQQIMENQLAYQKAKEDLEAQRGLRALFAQNPNATPEEVSRFSPQFGIEMTKAQQEMQERSGRMQKTRNEISEQEMKIFSTVGAQVAEKYAPYAMSGQMTPELMSRFHNEIGNATMQVEQQYGIKPPPGIDISRLDPVGVLTRAAPYYKSPLIENMMAAQKEQMLSQVPPRMTPQQAFGEVGIDPTTQKPYVKPPLPSRKLSSGQPLADLSGMSLADGDTGEIVPLTAENLPKLEQIYNKIPDVNQKNKVGAYLNQLKQQTQNQPELPMAGEIDVAKEKGNITKHETAGKISAEEEAADRKAIDAYFRSKPPEQVRNLIKESLSGDLEAGLARIGKAIGVSVPGGAPTAALQVITQQLASTSPFAPGSQSDVEYKARLAKIGDPASNEPIENRLAALDEFYRDQEAFVTQKWNPKSETEILDARKKGHISEENALEVFRRLKKSRSGAM